MGGGLKPNGDVVGGVVHWEGVVHVAGLLPRQLLPLSGLARASNLATADLSPATGYAQQVELEREG